MSIKIKNYLPAAKFGGVLDGMEIGDLGDLLDTALNEFFEFDQVTNAVNYIRIANAATGNAPAFSAQGDDADIDFDISPKGTGNTVIGTGAAIATLESKGDFDLVFQTGNAITGTLTVIDGAAGELIWTPSGVAGFTVTVTDDGVLGAILTLEQVSASQVANDVVGGIQFVGSDDGVPTQVVYATTVGLVIDPTAGAEFGAVGFQVMNGTAVLVAAARILHDGTYGIVEAGDGIAAGKFISSGDNDLIFETGNAVTGALTIANGAVGELTWAPSGVAGFTITVTDDGTLGAVLTLQQISTSAVLDDRVGVLAFEGSNSTPAQITYALIAGVVEDPAVGAEFGEILFQVQNGTGTIADAAFMGHDGTDSFLEIGRIENTANVGTAGTNCEAEEYGDGYYHITILTLTAVVLGTPNPSNNLAFGSEIYAFPAGGVHLHSHTYFSVGLTQGGVSTDQPDVGIGSVIGSGVIATLNGTTMEDYVTGITWATTLDGTARVQNTIPATAGLFAGISNNATGGTKEVFFNVADGWHANVTGDMTATGTVVLIWSTIA